MLKRYNINTSKQIISTLGLRSSGIVLSELPDPLPDSRDALFVFQLDYLQGTNQRSARTISKTKSLLLSVLTEVWRA